MTRRGAIALAILAASIAATSAYAGSPGDHWIGSWATAEQIPEPRNALPASDLTDASLRQVVHLSLGGAQLRVRLSNAFGVEPLHITAVHIARPLAAAAGAVDPVSDVALSFGGRPDVTIPAGAEYISDPAAFEIPPGGDLAISLHIDAAPSQETSHPGSRATSFLIHGDHVADGQWSGAAAFDHWFVIAGVDVVASPTAAAVVTLGDSITDGHGATTNGNDRWPDDLAVRLRGDGRPLSVLNHGIGGGRVLLDGLGPNALARFDRDVLAQPGARYLIVLEGINDIGTFDPPGARPQAEHDRLVADLTAAYAQMVTRAHAAGIKVYGATITPFADCGAYHPKPISEADRVAVNAWIRAPGHFDAVIDFDQALRDPALPDHLAAAYDSGDHLHPSPAGYRAMAAAIPLSLFKP